MLLSALASIHVFPASDGPVCLPEETVLLRTGPNGVCFWSCLFLHLRASAPQLAGWHQRPRNQSGFPCPEDCKFELQMVMDFGESLKEMPAETRMRFRKNREAVHTDIDAVMRFMTRLPC